MTNTDLKRPLAPPGLDGAPRPRRRWHPVAVGLVVGAAALGIFVALTPQAPRSETVLAVKTAVPEGAQVTAGDLAEVNVPPDGLAVVAAGQETSVLGRPAAVALVAGQLLAASDVGPPAAATDQVGLALSAGEYPPDLAVGDTVKVLVGQASSDGPLLGSNSRAVGATVVSVTASQSKPDGVLVTVAVSPSESDMVAAAAAVGAAVLIGS